MGFWVLLSAIWFCIAACDSEVDAVIEEAVSCARIEIVLWAGTELMCLGRMA